MLRDRLVVALPIALLLVCLSAAEFPVRKGNEGREFEHLPYEPLYQDILGIPVRKMVIAVDAGRNLAVLVEAAVRNTVLHLRGIDTYQVFIKRHQSWMDEPQ